MHLKTVVTEKSYASGSFNWTSAATNLNDEVLEVGRDETVRSQYEKTVREVLERYDTKTQSSNVKFQKEIGPNFDI